MFEAHKDRYSTLRGFKVSIPFILYPSPSTCLQCRILIGPLMKGKVKTQDSS